MVTSLSYGAAGLSVGQRVFGLTDWTRDGTLAEFAVEVRNLAPLPDDAHVIGTGRASHRQAALDFGAQEFVDLENDALDDVGGVDLVFDIFGGDLGKQSAALVRAGGILVAVAGPPEVSPVDGSAIDFVVVSDRVQLGEIAQRVRDGRLRTHIGQVAPLTDATTALNTRHRCSGKTVIRVRP